MKSFYTIVAICLAILATTFTSQAQTRYLEPVFNTASVTTVQYGSALNEDSTTNNLSLDLYLPDGDTATNRPVAIIAHGGSFYGGTRDQTSMVDICDYLARCGYVCASISYRLTTAFSLSNPDNMVRAVMRAVQDGKASVRFFRMDAANGNTYKIDSTRIYLGGESAGGILAYQVAYMNELSELTPAWQALATELGGMEGNSGNPGYSSEIQATFGYAGAVADTNFMDNADNIPFMGMHASGDGTVPYAEGYPLSLPTLPTLYGTAAMETRATNLGMESEFYSYSGGAHPPYVGNPDVYDSTQVYTARFLHKMIATGPTLEVESPVDTSTGIQTIKEQVNTLAVYPNPNTGSFTVNTNTTENYDIRVYNALGQEIKAVLNNGAANVTIELHNANNGLYFIRLFAHESNTTLQTTKFLIH